MPRTAGQHSKQHEVQWEQGFVLPLPTGRQPEEHWPAFWTGQGCSVSRGATLADCALNIPRSRRLGGNASVPALPGGTCPQTGRKGGVAADPLFARQVDPDSAKSASPIGDHKVICAQRALRACHLQVLCECLQPWSCACHNYHRLEVARTAVEWSTAEPGGSMLCSRCLLASLAPSH